MEFEGAGELQPEVNLPEGDLYYSVSFSGDRAELLSVIHWGVAILISST